MKFNVGGLPKCQFKKFWIYLGIIIDKKKLILFRTAWEKLLGIQLIFDLGKFKFTRTKRRDAETQRHRGAKSFSPLDFCIQTAFYQRTGQNSCKKLCKLLRIDSFLYIPKLKLKGIDI